MIKTYAIYGLVAVIAILGVRLYFAQGELADLKLGIETAKVEAERKYTKQLRAQQTVHDEAIKTERAREAANRRHYQGLLSQAQQEQDHANRAARSLIVLINGLLDRLTARFGAADAAAAGVAADDRTAASKAPESGRDQYTDIATALDDTVTWCETGWGRVQTIGEIQRAALKE